MARAAQIVFVTIPALTATAFGFFGGQWSRDYWPWWAWALISLGAAILSLLARITMRAYQLEQERVPKILISDPQDDFMPWFDAQEGKKANHHFYLCIKNESSSILRNCAVKDVSFINNRGHEAPIKGRHMRFRSERSAQPQVHVYTRQFDLRGHGDAVEIDICSMDERLDDSRVIMYYATKPTEQYGNAIIRGLFPHFLTISVTSDDLPRPEERKFKIFIEDGALKMEPA